MLPSFLLFIAFKFGSEDYLVIFNGSESIIFFYVSTSETNRHDTPKF